MPVFGTCKRCKKTVRLDKPLFGSLHYCHSAFSQFNDAWEVTKRDTQKALINSLAEQHTQERKVQ